MTKAYPVTAYQWKCPYCNYKNTSIKNNSGIYTCEYCDNPVEVNLPKKKYNVWVDLEKFEAEGEVEAVSKDDAVEKLYDIICDALKNKGIEIVFTEVNRDVTDC